MNPISKKDIIKAVETIIAVCEDNTCEICPFGRDSGVCTFAEYSPMEWEIHAEEPIWRAID